MAGGGPVTAALAELRKAGPDDFVHVLMQMPDARYPGLSAALPRMTDAEIQKQWTGATGVNVMQPATIFLRGIASRLAAGGKDVARAHVLDFGCGYGRMMRAALFYVDPARLFGCDPWDRSIDICRGDGVLGHLALSGYLPDSLPFHPQVFDAVFAFSVFTHLSRRAAEAALAAIRRRIVPDGLLTITIRPVEYWRMRLQSEPDPRFAEAMQVHEAEGFAFVPHNRPAVDGDVTYGDTSMSVAHLAARAAGWTVVGQDRALCDPFQLVVHLRPA